MLVSSAWISAICVHLRQLLDATPPPCERTSYGALTGTCPSYVKYSRPHWPRVLHEFRSSLALPAIKHGVNPLDPMHPLPFV